MGDPNDIINPFECPVCGYSAVSKEELDVHFEQKASDEEHQEYAGNPKEKEIIDEDSIGAPVGTPGHPGIDEGTDE